MEKSIRIRQKQLLSSLKKRAEAAFLEGDYEESMRQYSHAMILRKEDLESKVGLLLADLASDFETESKALYNYYQLLKRNSRFVADKVLLSLVESFDGNVSEMAAMTHLINSLNIDRNDGVLYSDFKKHVEYRGSFKEACEDMIFSTRIILTHRDEFVEFIESLVDNGFVHMALLYLDDINMKVPVDSRMGEIYKKIMEVL
ncbi:hypothetical protein CCZ01_00320 [Helicobacter monodelphidis]|uniref:hypothetical protein n=1 Tax=Helicobacter sp. 15-1451 TaxID=2004995 RepID=UPI000DCC5136|nr:hypothetical protein [Helicobacter sp. 15-1451]RAX59224.1 hypothetical protein CCZ01_00320 [Helicobacter sp. 15-1451]